MTAITDILSNDSLIKNQSLMRDPTKSGALSASTVAFSSTKTIREYLDLVAHAITV